MENEASCNLGRRNRHIFREKARKPRFSNAQNTWQWARGPRVRLIAKENGRKLELRKQNNAIGEAKSKKKG
ncbi:MAG: hypothetical protein QXR53_04180 [Candidatus Norongarragalinales archaeon]